MQAVEITSFGAPEVLQLGTRPDAVAGVGEVLIKVSASGINRPDVLNAQVTIPCRPARQTCRGWKWPESS